MFTTWNVLPASGNFTSPFKITLSNIFRLIVLVKRKITLITGFVLIRRTSRVFVLKVESEVYPAQSHGSGTKPFGKRCE